MSTPSDFDEPFTSSSDFFTRLQNNPSSFRMQMNIAPFLHCEQPNHAHQQNRGYFQHQTNPFGPGLGAPRANRGSCPSLHSSPNTTVPFPHGWTTGVLYPGRDSSCWERAEQAQSQTQTQSQPQSQEPATGTTPGTSSLHTLFQDLMTRIGTVLNQPELLPHTDFTPPIDIITTASQYIVHISLPGAKKEDISIDYDSETSTLRVAGVVHRPGVDEEMHRNLVVSERRKEIGVFERKVRLGTIEEPARVVGEKIEARLEEGILRLFVPKIQESEDSMETKGKHVMVESEEEEDAETPGNDMAREYVKVDVQ